MTMTAREHSVTHTLKEAVGEHFSLDAMLHARDKTSQVVDALAAAIRPGMRESEANEPCKGVLEELGMDRIWHPILVRFGEHTLKTFKQRSSGRSGTLQDGLS